MAEIDWSLIGPIAAEALAKFLAAERSRSGLTDEQIFARAGIQHDQNIVELLKDLERLKGASDAV